MRIFYFLVLTIVSFGLHTSDADLDDDKYDSVIDTKVVEYDENDEPEAERPNRKDRVRSIKNFVGTNLFGDTGSRKKCFSTEDIALLAARRDFESLIPKDLPNCLLDDELAKILMQYFYGAHQVIDKMAGGHSKILTQKAFFDTLGGYLKYYMIPITRYSFYAGLLKLRTVENVVELFTSCKNVLNTNGNGWKAALKDFTDLDIQIEPLRIVVRNEEEDTSCIQLDLVDEHTGEEEDMIVSLPRLDPEERGLLGNVWIPFKRKRTFNLRACMSAFVLLRYFELTTRCYSFQGVCQDTFNKKFKEWILENIEIHLEDDVLYPGLGAILRIVETLRRKNKGTVIVVPKTNAKRQKTQNFRTLENNAKKLEKSSSNWADNVFENRHTIGLSDDYTDTSCSGSQRARRMRLIYICIAVVSIILLLILLAFVLAIIKRRKREAAEKAKPEKKRLCPWFGRKSKNDDEERLVKSKSKTGSKDSAADKGKSSSSKDTKSKSKKGKDSGRHRSSSSPPETPKCFGICKKKKTGRETSSESGRGKKSKGKTPSPGKSSSPAPAKPKPKPKTKTVTVDEKKRFSISKKNKPKETGEKKGILKKDT